jgi:hypothetical protein
MTQKMLAIVVVLCICGGCAEPMPSTQAMTDEQRCVNSGGVWRAHSFCEAPSGPHTGRR